jgi:hypothetical protein
VSLRSRKAVLAIVGVPVLLLVLAQLFLPIIAGRLAKDFLSKYGTVKSVSVSAFPAIELLWGKADSVTVRAGSLSISASQLSQMVQRAWQARGITNATMTAERASVGASALLTHEVTASDIRAEKHGSLLLSTATITQQQLQEALPSGFGVQLLQSTGGHVLVRASGALFGAQASIDVLIGPREGTLVAEPEDIPFGGLVRLTLLSAPHVRVESVAVQVINHSPLTYRFSTRASLV